MPSFRPCSCKNRPNARRISPCIIVWCWDTPRAKVCNGYTAKKVIASFQIAKGGERRHVMCVGERPGLNPWPLWYQALRAANCARCPVDILQPISCEAVLRQSPPGPRHDSATGYRPWSLCRFAQYSLVCSGIIPFFCLCYNRHWIQVLRVCPCVDVGNIRWSWEW